MASSSLTESGREAWDVLILDPDPASLRLLTDLFPAPHRLATAGTAAEGESFLTANKVRVLLCSDDLPDLPGIMFLAQTADRWPGLQRVLMAEEIDTGLLLHAMREVSVFNYLPKPLDSDATRHLLEHALRQSKLMENYSKTSRDLDDARARIAGLSAVSGRATKAIREGGAGVLLFLFTAALLVAGTLLAGFTALYLLKSGLGIDIFPELHLRDVLPESAEESGAPPEQDSP